jgi:hypothetical protein
MNTQQLLTPIERERADRHRAICNDYKQLGQDFPTAAPYRRMQQLSIKYEMTVPGIRRIIEAAGLYKPQPRKA